MQSKDTNEIELKEKLEKEFGVEGYEKLKSRWRRINTEVNSEGILKKQDLFEIDATSLISGLDWKTVYETKIVRGSADGGIDGVHVAKETLFLIQTKFKNSQFDGKDFHKAPIHKMIDTYNEYFYKGMPLPSSCIGLDKFIKEYADSDTAKVEFIFVCLETKQKNALMDSFNKDNITMISYKDLILKMASGDWDKEISNNEFFVRIPFNVKERNGSKIDEHWYGMVEGDSFISQFSKLSDFAIDSLFVKNIRNRVVSKAFKDEIKETITSCPEYFQLFNNGITIVAPEIQEDNRDGLRIFSPQVVNGQQTLRTLIELYKNGCKLENIKIPVKILQIEDNELITKIARYSNNQTAVKKAELKVTKPGYQKIMNMAKSQGYYIEGKKGKTLSDEIVLSLLENRIIQLNELVRSHSASFHPEEYLGKSKVSISPVVSEYFNNNKLIDSLVEKENFNMIVDSIYKYEKCFTETETKVKEELKIIAENDKRTWNDNFAKKINHLKFGISIFYYVSNMKKAYDANEVVRDIYDNEAEQQINLFKSNEKANDAVKNSLERLAPGKNRN